MSAFTNGFEFGFVSGMFNRMFGGFNPFFDCNFFGGFNLMPSFNNSIFNTWTIQPTQQFITPAFNWNTSSNNNIWSSLPMGDSFTLSSTATSKSGANYSDTDTSNFSYDAETLKNKWSKKNPKLTQAFFNKVVQVAKRVNCNPNDLLCMMSSESGLNPSARNKSSNATGLIQFMPSTAKGLGTSCSALSSMSAEQQMVYVEKCIMNSKKMAGLGNQKIGPGTLYALIFLPARAGKDILTTRGEKYYNSNKGLDLDNDGKITKADLAKRIKKFDIA